MTERLWGIVNNFRNDGISVSDEEAEYVCKFCFRKMEVGKIQNKDEYLPVLFKDEIRNYIYRRAVNATSILRMEENKVCAAYV